MSLDLKQKISDTIFNNGIAINDKAIDAIYDLFILTNPSLKKWTGDIMDRIDLLAMDHFRIDSDELYGASRKRRLADCRSVCMYLGRKYSGLALSQIGARYGKRDHTTVIHANNKIKNLMQCDDSIRDAVNFIENQINVLGHSSLSIAI